MGCTLESIRLGLSELPLYTNGNSFSFRTESDYEIKFNKHIVLPSFLYLFLLQFGEINLGSI